MRLEFVDIVGLRWSADFLSAGIVVLAESEPITVVIPAI